MMMSTLQLTGRSVFYTDGSVQDIKAGIGIAHNGMISSLRLNNNATIIQAELAAIREALKMAKDDNLNTALIVTDSKSAMAVINATTPKVNIKLIKEIHTSTSQLLCIPEIIWVPAHEEKFRMGIHGGNPWWESMVGIQTTSKQIQCINPIRSGLFQTVNDPGGGGL